MNGAVTAYEYDLAVNVTSVTDAEDRRIEFTYDNAGNLLEVIYPDKSKDVTEYDALGRVIKTTPRTGLATAYEYDVLGNVTSITQGEQVTGYTYDLLGRLIKVTTPDGAETAYEYDALGNLIGTTDPLGSSIAFRYTAENLLEMVTDANGHTQSLGYDLAGNVVSETDGEGNTKQYKYDKVNRLTAVVDEMGKTTSYTYDPLDNIAKVTDALRQVTRYTYDKNGNLTSETDALGNKVEYTYTPEGWLESMIKADGDILTFEYDKAGGLLTQNVGEGQSVSSDYNEIGMVTKVSSTEGDIVYQYDAQGYLVSVENVNGDMVSYTYDVYGNKTSMTYPDGRIVSYEYDNMNRMTSVMGLDGEKTTYAYDAAGRRVQTKTGSTAASTLTTTYQYDSVGNLLKQATSGLSDISFAYSYNKNNYITEETRKESGKTITSNYAYDPLGELTSFIQSTGYGESYSYDAVGNMLKKVITPEHGASEEVADITLNMKYNKGNQLTTMSSGKDKIAYHYDPNGSMVEKTLTSKEYGKLTDIYAYDVLDQLTSYIGYDGYTQQFSYDANGMRTTKKEAGNSERSTLEELLRGEIAGLPDIIEPTIAALQDDAAALPSELEWATTEYLYDITQEYYQVIEETTSSKNGSTTTAYAYGLERIAGYSDDVKTSYTYDGRGSVVQAMTSPVAGEGVAAALPDVKVSVESFGYTAFGEQMGGVKQSGFAYNAEAFDAATGMINLRARQYEPTVGRFGQKDRLRGERLSPVSQNRYTYALNIPTMFIDSSGLAPHPGKILAFSRNFITNVSTNYARYFTNTNSAKVISDALKRMNTYYNQNKSLFDSAAKATYNSLRAKAQKALASKIQEKGKDKSVNKKDFEAYCRMILDDAAILDVAGIVNNINLSGGMTKERAVIVDDIVKEKLDNADFAPLFSDAPAPDLNPSTIDRLVENLINLFWIPSAYSDGLSYIMYQHEDEYYGITPWDEKVSDWLRAHKNQIITTAVIIGLTAVTVTLTITSAGAAAYAIGVAGGYQILSTGAVDRIVNWLVAGSAGGLVIIQANEIYGTWTGENVIRDNVLGGNQQTYDDIELAFILSNLGIIHLGVIGNQMGYGKNDPAVGENASSTLNEKTIDGFNETESSIIKEARQIMNSTELEKLKAAHESGQSVTIVIDGRTIQYEPNLNASGMTMFGENGFIIGNEAFQTTDELTKTVLHELHRLATSTSAGGVNAELAALETQAAYDFANKALDETLKP